MITAGSTPTFLSPIMFCRRCSRVPQRMDNINKFPEEGEDQSDQEKGPQPTLGQEVNGATEDPTVDFYVIKDKEMKVVHQCHRRRLFDPRTDENEGHLGLRTTTTPTTIPASGPRRRLVM